MDNVCDVEIIMYADYTVLLTSNEDVSVAVTSMQTAVDTLSRWCATNKLTINIQ